MECIKLQTDSSDVMGKVREIIIREKYIYAQDVLQQSVFVFDKKGRFISKLAKRGEGPDEYVWMGPIYIDEKERYIDVISFPACLFISSYYGDCAHEISFNDYLVDIVLPSSYFRDGNIDRVFVDGVGKITAEDNPVIVMIKLKKELIDTFN